MPAFNFQKQFAPDVESGQKNQTIRAKRKDGRRPEPGQTAYLYTGMRTNACRKLGEKTIEMVQMIMIGNKGCLINYNEDGEYPITELMELKFFAIDDGFESWEAMRDWFDKTHGLPFEGDLIKW
jgi:phosphoribosyl-ATP pyrophosphohydrolase